MKIHKNGMKITACDVCGNPLTSMRVKGQQGYEGHDCNVCSSCCANPEKNTDSQSKIKFLIDFYHKSREFKDGIPPFWPINADGIKMDIELLRTMA